MASKGDAAGAGTPSGDRQFAIIEQHRDNNATLLTQALHLARDGFWVLPCRNDKSPACRHGLLDATTDATKLTVLFGGRNASLIGVRTGTESGVAVLDLDGEPGLAWLARERANLPSTLTIETRRGGAHLWYRIVDGMPAPPSTASRIAPGVDTRGRGGYAIGWTPGLLNKRNMAVWPVRLTELLRPATATVSARRRSDSATNKANEKAALFSAARRVASAPKGTRNTVLNVEAFTLARFTGLNAHTIRDELTLAALHAGLEKKEIAATIASALTAGTACR